MFKYTVTLTIVQVTQTLCALDKHIEYLRGLGNRDISEEQWLIESEKARKILMEAQGHA